MVRGILDSLVIAASGLPRLGSNPVGGFSSLGGKGPQRGGDAHSLGANGTQGGLSSSNLIPSTGLQEDEVVEARKEVMSIMQRNSGSPVKLSEMFDEWMYLVGEESEAFSEFHLPMAQPASLNPLINHRPLFSHSCSP